LKNKFGKTGDLAKNGTNAETIVEKLSLDVLQRLKILMTVSDSFFVFFFSRVVGHQIFQKWNLGGLSCLAKSFMMRNSIWKNELQGSSFKK
jgi:hypothetical protein